MTTALQPTHVSHTECYNVLHPTHGYIVASIHRVTESAGDDSRLTYGINISHPQSLLTDAELRAVGELMVAIADLDDQQ